MAHIEDRWKNGDRSRKRWRARMVGADGRERSRSFDRKLDAERWLVSAEGSKHRGEWVDPNLGRTPLGEWAERWLESKRNLKPKTRYGYRNLLNTRVLPTFGNTRLNRIERLDIERWVSAMVAEGLSASRTRQAYNVLAAALDAAVANGYLVKNVARGVELPRVKTAERRFLSPNQVAAFASAVEERHRALILTLAYGGLRWGEAVALRRKRVDLLRGRVEIAEAATEVGGRLEWGTPKTHQTGSVSVPRFVTEALAEHLAHFAEDDPHALVFTDGKGGPLRHGRFLHGPWRRALRLARLPTDLTPHELRHTCAALLIAEGADPKAIQAQLRHSSIQVTFDVYGHLFPGHLDDVMGRLDAAFRETLTAPRRPEDDPEAPDTLFAAP